MQSFGILLIGDELLSGKRNDKHQARTIDLLAQRGLDLAWSLTIGDDAARLQSVLEWTFSRSDIVFSFGGIGATPDDRTRQCAAAAAGLPLAIHPRGREILEQRLGRQLYPHRIRMVEFPQGAELIPNPVNQVPGFSLRSHHFVPGFPSMAWPMIEWVLDQYYVDQKRPPAREYLLEVPNTPESDLIDLMETIMAAHPQVRLSCLPDSNGRRVVELGVRGPQQAAVAGYQALLAGLEEQGLAHTPLAAPEV